MRWTRTPDGVIVPGIGLLQGRVAWSVNGGAWARHHNLLTDEGIDFLVDNWGVDPTPPSAPTFYMSLFGDDVTPLASWTAATYPAAAGEIASVSEGYTEGVRQLWPLAFSAPDTETAPVGPFTIATASTLQVCGIGLHTVDTWGDTSGVLLSAMRFPDAPQTRADLERIDVTYAITATRIP